MTQKLSHKGENISEENISEENISEENISEENISEENISEENILGENILKHIKNDDFRRNTYLYKSEYVNIPVEYIPNYIKETTVYKDFLETVDDGKISIPFNKLPFPSVDKVILDIDFL